MGYVALHHYGHSKAGSGYPPASSLGICMFCKQPMTSVEVIQRVTTSIVGGSGTNSFLVHLSCWYMATEVFAQKPSQVKASNSRSWSVKEWLE